MKVIILNPNRILILGLIIFSITQFLQGREPSEINKEIKKEVEREVERIVSQKKYQYEEPAPLANEGIKENKWYKKLLAIVDAVIKAIRSLLNLIRETSLILYYFLAAVIFIGLGAAAFFLIRLLAVAQVGKEKKMPPVRLNEGHYNYEKDLTLAALLIKEGDYKGALPLALNALWLYFHARKITAYHMSKTNREYLKDFISSENYPLLKSVVFEAESVVYSKETINEAECGRIFKQVKEIIYQ